MQIIKYELEVLASMTQRITAFPGAEVSTILETEKGIPDFVKDGGHWYNPDDETLIGTVADDADDIPDSIATLTLAELETRQLAINTEYPMRKNPESTEAMTEAEIRLAIQTWMDGREQ